MIYLKITNLALPPDACLVPWCPARDGSGVRRKISNDGMEDLAATNRLYVATL